MVGKFRSRNTNLNSHWDDNLHIPFPVWHRKRWETIKKTRNYCYTVAKNIFVANTHILVLSVSQWFFITLIWDGNRSDEEGGEQLSSHLHNGCLFPATFVFFKVIFSWDQNELSVSWTDLFSFLFFFISEQWVTVEPENLSAIFYHFIIHSYSWP